MTKAELTQEQQKQEIQALIKAKPISVSKLAGLAGVHLDTIHNCIRGKKLKDVRVFTKMHSDNYEKVIKVLEAL